MRTKGIFMLLLGILPMFCPLKGQTPTETDMQEKPELIYVGDPMCSWCWGISNEVDRLTATFENDIKFRLVLGGLRPGTTTPMDNGMRQFLRHHWEEVNKLSGQPFSFGILDSTDFVYDTEPACRAVVIARSFNPGLELAFFREVQKAFYVENKNTNKVDCYLEICRKLGLDESRFLEAWESGKYLSQTQKEFIAARNMGVSSFPTILLRKGKTVTPLAVGYASFDQLQERLLEQLTVKAGQ